MRTPPSNSASTSATANDATVSTASACIAESIAAAESFAVARKTS